MEHRARNHLMDLRGRYREAFDFMDGCHADKGDGIPDWPDWCYVPIAAGITVAQAAHVGTDYAARFAALSAWRMTQGIYRFDPTLYTSLIETPVTGDIPTDTLYRMPEWCVYIETPEAVDYEGTHIHGAFVWLEHDVNTHGDELRMLLDMDFEQGPDLLPAVVHFGGTVQDGIDAVADEALRRADGVDFGQRAAAHGWLEPVSKVLSLLLYMCSVSDYQRKGVDDTPANPTPKRTKSGMRLFGTGGPAMWDVGVRMGSALRATYHAQQLTTGGSHASPRGHVRRGHWHSFRAGPMLTPQGDSIPAASRDLRVKWLPPIPVNLPDVGEMPATVRPVR